MSQFKVVIRCNNAAFEDGGRSAEVARLLRESADRVERGDDAGGLRDVNGNNVGGFVFQEDDEPRMPTDVAR